LPAASVIEAVRRVSLVADRASPVRLTFEPGTVALEAQTEGRARAAERVTASFHGDEPVIAFNPHYLLDGLTTAAAGAAAAQRAGSAGSEAPDGGTTAEGSAAAAQGATIRIEFTSPAKPALITLASREDDAGARPAFRYLVVPLRSPARA
jgi:DNA polymerase III subunit beta